MLKLLGLLFLGVVGVLAAVTTAPAVTATAASSLAASPEDRPFAFPLDASPADSGLFYADFEGYNERPGRPRTYHAARDFSRPAGTPVYAMADGLRLTAFGLRPRSEMKRTEQQPAAVGR